MGHDRVTLKKGEQMKFVGSYLELTEDGENFYKRGDLHRQMPDAAPDRVDLREVLVAE